MGQGGCGRLAAALAVLAVLAGLVTGQPAGAEECGQMPEIHYPHTQLWLVTAAGTRTAIKVELATSQEQLMRGLMCRHALAADAGMLFDFGAPRLVAMWMRNTFIPLDVLFMDQTGRIIDIEQNMVPHSTEARGPSQSALAALELPAGTAARLGVRQGDRVEHAIFQRAPVGFR